MKNNSMLPLVFPVNSSFVPQLVPYVNWGFFKLLHSQPSSKVDQSFKVHSNNESQISVAKKTNPKSCWFFTCWGNFRIFLLQSNLDYPDSSGPQ